MDLKCYGWFMAGALSCWIVLQLPTPSNPARLSSCLPTIRALHLAQDDLNTKNQLVRKLWAKLLSAEEQIAAATGESLGDQELPLAEIDRLMRHAAFTSGVSGREYVDQLKDQLSESGLNTPISKLPPVRQRSQHDVKASIRRGLDRLEIDGCSASPKLSKYLDAQRNARQTEESDDMENLSSPNPPPGGGSAQGTLNQKFHCIRQVASNLTSGGTEWAWLPC